MCEKRIMREMKEVSASFNNVELEALDGDIFNLVATINGPIGTPYENGRFIVTIKIPHDYPFVKPRVVFRTNVYHPQVCHTGLICLDCLKSRNWTMSTGIKKILSEIIQMMTDLNFDPSIMYLNVDVFKVAQKNKDQFLKTAKEWTEKYAD